MSAESSSAAIDSLIENLSSNEGERLAKLEGESKYWATREDIARLEGVINKNNAELRGFIKETVSKSEIRTLKHFVTFWVTVAGLSIPILSTVFYILANQLLPDS